MSVCPERVALCVFGYLQPTKWDSPARRCVSNPPSRNLRQVKPVDRIRCRIINFRVTNDEFERLKSACSQQGARCLSEFARSIILGNAAIPPGGINERLLSFESRLAKLELSLMRFQEAIAGLISETAKSHE